MKSKTKKKDNTKNNNIIISRIINAPPRKVFDVWTKPKHIKHWWGPEHFTAPIIKVDLRKGGKYLYCMQGPDGKKYWSGGKFIEVEIPKRVVVLDYFADEKGNKIDPAKVFGADIKIPKESIVTVTFDDYKGKTKLTILYSPKTLAEKKALIKVQMVEGWNTSLDKLVVCIKNS